MSITATARRTEALFVRYQTFLDQIGENDFQRNPAAGIWSYAEVYSHIFTANQACFMAIGNCINGKAEATNEKARRSGRIILFLGIFPPVKIKAPKRIAEMVQKIDREEAKKQLQQLQDMLRKVLPGIADADSGQKAKHPFLGYFDARQWLRFIEIHTRHHLKQLVRIEKALKNSR